MAKIKRKLVKGTKSVYLIDYPSYKNETAATWKDNKKTISRAVKSNTLERKRVLASQ